jgi:hypothetical protein
MFETNESFKHRLAKKLLLTWLNDRFLRIVEEESFSTKGFLRFIVDLACYNETGLCEIYEIVHTSEVNLIKQWVMYNYFNQNKIDIKVYRVSADWILNQVKKPLFINKMRIL